jgi:hypothetical protein
LKCEAKIVSRSWPSGSRHVNNCHCATAKSVPRGTVTWSRRHSGAFIADFVAAVTGHYVILRRHAAD